MDKVKRPSVVDSTTVQMVTGCGNIYVTIGICESKVIEVFSHLGKSGGCSNCQNEALGRAVSLGLKFGVPLEDYIEELKGIRCPNPNLYPQEERTLSCADAIGSALENLIKSGKIKSNGDLRNDVHPQEVQGCCKK